MDGFTPFFVLFLVTLPSDFLSSTDFIQSPEPVCAVCRIHLLIRLNNNNLTESTVFWGVSKLSHLTERSDDTQNQHKARGRDIPKDGKVQNSPFQQQKVAKIPPLHPVTALSAYSQHSSRICFQHANPHMVWARQSVVKPFYWSVPALWHFSLLRSLFFCEWQVVNIKAQ